MCILHARKLIIAKCLVDKQGRRLGGGFIFLTLSVPQETNGISFVCVLLLIYTLPLTLEINADMVKESIFN